MNEPSILVLHGLGQDPARGVAELAEALPSDAALVAPPGPLPFQQGLGRAWFEVSLTEAGPKADLAQEEASRSLVLGLAGGLVGDKSPLIVGFGQGGVVALTAFLHKPDLFAGCAMVGGRVLVEALPPPALAHAGKSLFWAHGRADPAIPFSLAGQGRTLLEPYHLVMTACDHDEGHILPSAIASALRRWIDDVRAR